MEDSQPKLERVKPPKRFVRISAPLMRLLATKSKLMSKYMLVLHFTGRKTGREYRVPIGYRIEGGRIMTLSNDVWRHNFTGGRKMEVTYLRQRLPGSAMLESDPEALADFYAEKLAEMGPKKVAADLGIKINLDRSPTREEWIEGLKRVGMNRIWIDPS